MGLNIGVRVKQQEEGYMRFGCNPKGTLEEISEEVRTFVESRVPNVSALDDPDDKDGCAYTVHDVELRDGWYVFDIRPRRYGSLLPDWNIDQLYHALLVWIADHFSHEDGIEMRTYWAG